ncbi:MAG: ABC transporter ATP-binding protein [Ignavibacteriaceae bacterium]|nr:ABC transporter ATP-binding protein [Ignavibacteriaceae bacterium]
MTLKINNLSKIYPNGVKALDNLSLEIKQGMFGLLGPNGAGKSSLMRTLATLQTADEGSVYLDDIDIFKDPMELRKVLGYLPQDFGVYPKMSAVDLLDYLAILKGIASRQERNTLIKQVLEITNLYEVRKKFVDGYSGGMKQRFGIAQLLLNNPKLIIVDEPTAGLDPAERNRFLNVLREIASSNIIIFSTHIVDDIKDLCNDMAIMNGGRILNKIIPFEATKEIENKIWTSNIEREKLEKSEQLFSVLSSKYNQDNSINIRVYANEQPSSNFVSATPNLEDVYFLNLKYNVDNAK